MMRRGIPNVFQSKRAREHFTAAWPWALGSLVALMYMKNPDPFDQIYATVMTKIRKPLLVGTEWMELHDLDPEAIVLELPPDQLFGPMPFEKRMEFLLHALKGDNELADGYMVRMCIDEMDISLEPPLVSEERVLAAGGMELMEFIVSDFTEKRHPRKHKFFHPDAFLRAMNWLSEYPKIAEAFVNKHDGASLILTALENSNIDYSRVFAMRALTLMCFTQRQDGNVEKHVLQGNGMRKLVDCYSQSTGDPVDTRYLTLPLSSTLRHFPKEALTEFMKAEGLEAIVRNLDVSKYKGFPQHMRIVRDIQKICKTYGGKKKGTVPSLDEMNKKLYEADILPVVIGIIDAFPEYQEIVEDCLSLLQELLPHSSPLEYAEFSLLASLGKVFDRYKTEDLVETEFIRSRMMSLYKTILEDKDVQACVGPSAPRNFTMQWDKSLYVMKWDWEEAEKERQEKLHKATAQYTKKMNEFEKKQQQQKAQETNKVQATT